MDVRCEKCQTEYELDEARLKPGGVTVKCTNCGHMFKIRKRTNTNVGASAERPATAPVRAATPAPSATSNGPPRMPAPAPLGMRPTAGRADSVLDEAPTERALHDEGPTTVDRQWLIRLENGEQKSCRELATLQQWIVSCVVSRESLISRTGKTWKRLGDIAELAQYFDIADEARTTRDERRAAPTPAPPARAGDTKKPAGTVLGIGNAAAAAGGTILPDDEEGRTTGNFTATTGGVARRPITQPPPPPKSAKTPPMGSNAATPVPAVAPVRRPPTQPPPPPKPAPGPVAQIATAAAAPAPPDVSWREPNALPSLKGPAPEGNRATAGWADAGRAPAPKGPVTGPFVGNLSAIPDEPAFAGRVRVGGADESSFETGKVRLVDDDDDELLHRRRGGSHGILILVMVLLVASAAGAAIYFFVIRSSDPAAGSGDGSQVANAGAEAGLAAVDAAVVVTPVIDAADKAVPSPLEVARGALALDLEDKLQQTVESLAGKDDAQSLALRALAGTQRAQGMLDRAGLAADKVEADKLRKDVKNIVVEAATAAQKAHKEAPDEPATNIALAAVLRLQGKPTKDVQRYIDAARGKPGDWIREIALAEALLHKRDGKLDAARSLFAAIDDGDNKMEVSNDVRARFQLALIAHAQNRPNDAKPLVDQILTAQKDHAAARALAAKLDMSVAKTDPLPPEDPGKGSGSGSGGKKPPPTGDEPISGDYDTLVRKAEKYADSSNCSKANEYYLKALEKKSNGTEALTGLGNCALLAKNFDNAHSRFRTALATSPRYGPALVGIAEAFTQQNRKDDALAAWKRVLDAFPSNARAKEMVAKLGGGTDTPPPTPPTPPPNGGSNTPPGPGSSEPPPPPPAPTPTPTPAPPAGSASG